MSVQLVQPIIQTTQRSMTALSIADAPPRLRAATPKDVVEITALINHFAARGDMLPRQEESVRQRLGEFIVAEANQKVVACGALQHWDDESAEVRSLAVAEEYAGRGLGTQIVQRLIERGMARGYVYAFALTLQVRFFEKLGFHVVSKSTLSQKVWGDCIICPFLYNCRETAVLRNLKA